MKRGIALWFVFVIAGFSAAAQNSDSLSYKYMDPDSVSHNKVLTFEQAVLIGLRNGVLLRTQQNNQELNQMQRLSSIVSIAPNISASGGVSRNIGNSFNQKTGKVIQGTLDQLSGGLNANITLFSGFSKLNGIRQYSNLLTAQNYFVKRTAQDLINTIATQYLNVMLDVELVRIGRTNWKILAKQLSQVKEQVVLGAKAPVDEYNQTALTKAAELTYVQAEVQLINDKALLAQTILIDAFEDFDTERPSWDVNAIGNEQLDPDQMANNAKQLRGDYLRALYNERGYRFATMAARGLLLPSVGASFSYSSSYNFQHGIPRLTPNDTTGVLERNPNYPLSFHDQFQRINPQKTFQIGVSIPILSGLQNRTYMVQQRVLYENAVVTRENVEMQIRNDVMKAVKNFDAAKRIYSITADKIDYAEKALELETYRFNLGVTSFVEYTNANRVLVQAQTDKAQAEYKLVFQKIMLAYATGDLKPEDVTAATQN